MFHILQHAHASSHFFYLGLLPDRTQYALPQAVRYKNAPLIQRSLELKINFAKFCLAVDGHIDPLTDCVELP